MNIYLSNGPFDWTQYENIYFKGYITNELYSENLNLVKSSLVNIKHIEELKKILKDLNGAYSIIIEMADKIIACVDHIRSFPLFYCLVEGELLLSDCLDILKSKISQLTYDQLAIDELKMTGFITKDDTIYEQIKKLEAGQFLVFDKNTRRLQIHSHYQFHHSGFIKEEESSMLQRLDECYMNAFKRMIGTLQNKTVVVPLSGGCDSRCIAVALKRLGYQNVICFTYGVKGNHESKISEATARLLGYQWEFVEYSNEKWNKWYHSPEMKAYFEHSSSGAAIPIIQDWPAVLELKHNNKIPENSIFIPGYSGDMVAGSHIPKEFLNHEQIPHEYIIRYLFSVHYSLWNLNSFNQKSRDYFINKINTSISSQHQYKTNYGREVAADIIEAWDYQYRQANFINNALRVYEFWGFQWRTPFWDKEILQYWKQVPWNLRINRNLYFKYDRALKETYLKGIFDVERDLALEQTYNNHPMAWYGIISLEQYKEKSKAANSYNINAFIADDVVTRLSETIPDQTGELKKYVHKVNLYGIMTDLMETIKMFENQLKIGIFDKGLIEGSIEVVELLDFEYSNKLMNGYQKLLKQNQHLEADPAVINELKEILTAAIAGLQKID